MLEVRESVDDPTLPIDSASLLSTSGSYTSGSVARMCELFRVSLIQVVIYLFYAPVLFGPNVERVRSQQLPLQTRESPPWVILLSSPWGRSRGICWAWWHP